MWGCLCLSANVAAGRTRKSGAGANISSDDITRHELNPNISEKQHACSETRRARQPSRKFETGG